MGTVTPITAKSIIERVLSAQLKGGYGLCDSRHGKGVTAPIGRMS